MNPKPYTRHMPLSEAFAAQEQLVAEVLVGPATDTTVYLSWRWERVKSTS